jgi:hypothetical protein
MGRTRAQQKPQTSPQSQDTFYQKQQFKCSQSSSLKLEKKYKIELLGYVNSIIIRSN